MYEVVYGSAQYASEDRQMINVTIIVKGEKMPFTASPNDPDPYSFGKEIYTKAVFGEYGPVADYVPFDVPSADPLTLLGDRLDARIDALEARIKELEEK